MTDKDLVEKAEPALEPEASASAIRSDEAVLRRRFYLRTAVAAAACALAPLVIRFIESYWDDRTSFLPPLISLGVAIGACFGQSAFAAAWVILGEGRLRTRLLTAMLLTIPMAFVTSVLIEWPVTREGFTFLVVTIILDLVAFAAAACLLSVMRLRYGIVLGGLVANQTAPLQFSLRGMIAFTTAAAVLLGIFRLTNIGSRDPIGTLAFWESWGLYIVVTAAAASLLTLAILSPAWAVRTLFALIACVLVTGVGAWWIQWVERNPSYRTSLYVVATINSGLFGSLTMHLVRTRGCGYRVRSAK